MLYSIVGTDIPDSTERRAAVRDRHLAYIRPLMDAGRIIIAGPCPVIDSPEPGPAGMVGSLIVAEFDSLEDAQQWAVNDPYMLDGVFESVAVHPFIRVYP